jgi:hypothetical protein
LSQITYCGAIALDRSGSIGVFSKRIGDFQIIETSCLSPGKNKLTITQTNSNEPWTELVAREIILQAGDNELTIELPPDNQ